MHSTFVTASSQLHTSLLLISRDLISARTVCYRLDRAAKTHFRAGLQAQGCSLWAAGRLLCDTATVEGCSLKDGMTLQLVQCMRGGASALRVNVKPRIQKDKWSLYWKESMETKTEILNDVQLDLPAAATLADFHKALQEKMGWPDPSTLERAGYRLEGFKDPWEVSVYKGRQINPDSTLATLDFASDHTIICVRRVLIPEGWKIIEEGQDEDDLSSDDEDW